MQALSAARRLLPRTRPGLARGCGSGPGAPRNPLVYLDVGADEQPLGRVVLEVRGDGAGWDGTGRSVRQGRAAKGRREGSGGGCRGSVQGCGAVSVPLPLSPWPLGEAAPRGSVLGTARPLRLFSCTNSPHASCSVHVCVENLTNSSFSISSTAES